MSGPDCFVVVRAAGERTEAACARLAGSQVGEANVRTIREVPFSEAVRRGFEIGVEAGRAWTLCLDADVLLRPGAIAALCAAGDAEWAASPDLFEIEGRVADKLLGQLRPAGAHLYRTSLLEEALRTADFNAKKRRPESHVKRCMRKAGYRTAEIADVLGLHDHEQSYRDLFRKVFTHARKHERFMTYAQRYWRRAGASDDDLRFAYVVLAMAHAINEHANLDSVPAGERVAIDVRAFPGDVEALLKPLGLEEKAPLDPGEYMGAAVEDALDAFREAPEAVRERPVAAALNRGRLGQAKGWLDGYGPLGAAREFGARRLSAVASALAVKER